MKKIETFAELLTTCEGTKFVADLSNNLNVNGKPMPMAVWNLLISIRDCKLFTKGMKPHRFWKISDVKAYFGIKGSAEVMAATLENFRDVIMNEMPRKETDQ